MSTFKLKAMTEKKVLKLLKTRLAALEEATFRYSLMERVCTKSSYKNILPNIDIHLLRHLDLIFSPDMAIFHQNNVCNV